MSLEARGPQLKSDFSGEETLSVKEEEVSGGDAELPQSQADTRVQDENCRSAIIGSVVGYLSAGNGEQRIGL